MMFIPSILRVVIVTIALLSFVSSGECSEWADELLRAADEVENSKNVELEKINRKAILLHNDSKFDEALELYGAILQKRPHDKRTRINIINCLKDASRYPQAASLLETWLLSNPGDSLNYRLLYHVCPEDQKLRVIKRWKTAVSSDPEPYFKLSEYYNRIESPDKSLKELEQAERIARGNPEPLIRLRDYYESRGNAAKALRWSARLVELQPLNINFLTKHSSLLSEAGKPEEAIRLLEKAVEDHPAETGLRVRLADMLEKNGFFNKAELMYREMVAGNPSLDRYAGMRLADILLKQGKVPEARRQYRLNITKYPDFFSQYGKYIECEEKNITAGEGADFLYGLVSDGKALNASALNALIHLWNASSTGIAVQIEKMSALRSANPGSTLILDHLIDLHLSRQDYKSAINTAQEALLLDSDSTKRRLQLAELHRRAGNMDEALNIVSQVTASQPTGDALYLQGELYQTKGDMKKAKDSYQQALKNNSAEAAVALERLKKIVKE